MDLKQLRENEISKQQGGLKLSQQELADILGVSQENISRWERMAENEALDSIPSRIQIKLANLAGMSIEELNGFVEENSNIFQEGFDDPFKDHRERISLLNQYVDPQTEKISSGESGFPVVHDLLEELSQLRTGLQMKPIISIIGSFDSGKSSLVNRLLGSDVVPTGWQPMTAIPAFIRHVETRPNKDKTNEGYYLIENKDKDIRKSFNFRKLDDKKYMKEEGWELIPCERSRLEDVTTKRSDRKEGERPKALLVYSSAPILLSCDLLDTPGFDDTDDSNSDSEKSVATTSNDLGQADGHILMSKINGFLNASDVLRLNELLRRGGITLRPDCTKIPFGNVLIVASQADIISKEKEIQDICQRASVRVFGEKDYSSLTSHVFEQWEQIYGRPIERNDFLTRIVPFSIKHNWLQVEFKKSLKSEFIEPIVHTTLMNLSESVRIFKEKAVQALGIELKQYEEVSKEKIRAKEQLQLAKETREENRYRLRQEREELISLVRQLRRNTAKKASNWWDEMITPVRVEEEIRKRKYNRKQAQEYIVQNIVDLLKDQLSKILDEDTNKHLKPAWKKLMSSYESYAKRCLSFAEMSGLETPFNLQGAIAGGLSASVAMGALTLIASSFGNLGWYILVAKGVSLLSSLGISLGGTSAVISTVAALGGPIMWALGLTTLGGILIAKLFGDSWQTRLAKKVCEELNARGVRNAAIRQIEDFWDDTEKEVSNVTEEIEKRMDSHMKDMEGIVETAERGRLEPLINQCKQHREFFEKIPWLVSRSICL